MRVLFGFLIAGSIGLGLWFIVSYGRPWRSDYPAMAWLQSALAAVPVAFDSLLLLALFKLTAPVWLVVAILAAQDVVFGWRVVTLMRARRTKG